MRTVFAIERYESVTMNTTTQATTGMADLDHSMFVTSSMGNISASTNSTLGAEPESLKPLEIVRMMLSVVGLIGNTISFFVFSRKTFSHLSVSVFLRILAVLDNCVIIVYNVVSVYHSFTTPDVVTVEMGQLPRIGTWFIVSLATSSAWTLVLVSLERVSAVCIPFHVRFIFTKKRAIVTGLCVIPLSFVANLSELLLEPRKGDAWARPEVFAIIYSGIPSLVLITTSAIVLTAMHRRRELLRNRAENRGLSIMLIVSCAVFVVLTIAFPIYEVCTKKLENEQSVRSILIMITGLNHAVNFIFYGLSGTLFRQELKIMLCARCMDVKRPGSCRKSTETGTVESSANGKGKMSRENSAFSDDGNNVVNNLPSKVGNTSTHTVRESTVELCS